MGCAYLPLWALINMAIPLPTDFVALIQNTFGTNIIFFAIFFFIFIFIMYKLFQLAIRLAIIAVLGGAFPLIMDRFFGYDIPITVQNIIWFALFAVGLYFIFAAARLLYKVIRFGTGGGKKVVEKVVVKEKSD